MNTDEKIREIMHVAVADIRARIASEGENASGRTSESFQVRKIKDCHYQIIQYGSRFAPDYTLEKGRKGGKVPAGFYQILKQWSVDKGIAFDTERERGTFAYFLSKRIAREGTLRNKNNVVIFDPPMSKANRDIRLATEKTLRGYVGAHMRYAMDSLKVKAQGVKKAITDFFRW